MAPRSASTANSLPFDAWEAGLVAVEPAFRLLSPHIATSAKFAPATDASTTAADDLDVMRSRCVDADLDLKVLAEIIDMLLQPGMAQPQRIAALVQHEGLDISEVQNALRIVLRCLALLHRCGYQRQDVAMIAAHAAAYFEQVQCMWPRGNRMDIRERMYIFGLLLFLAHTFVQDETCPLRLWHKHVFAQYCSLATLNAAVMKLLERLGYICRVDGAEIERRLLALRCWHTSSELVF